MKLSKLERFTLALQLEMLKSLDPDNSDYHERDIKVLSNGYELEYGELFNWIYDPLNVEGCKEVIDILRMYDALQRSSRKLCDGEDIVVSFPGFDANYDGEQLGYLRFIVEDTNRFDYLDYRCRDENFNSHGGGPGMDGYRSMLYVWKSLNEKYELNKEEMLSILKYWKNDV